MSDTLISWSDFEKIEMRIGTIVGAEIFAKAKKPAYIITVDFGPYGIKKTSAQITTLYKSADIIGRQVVGVINFPKKQIADIQSEFLLLGAVNGTDVTLLHPGLNVNNGLRIS